MPLSELLHWLQENETLVWSLTLLSVATFVGTLLAIPLLVVRLPADYFVREPREPWPTRHALIHLLLVIGKNLLGFVLLVAGVSMLVLPGQGLLTMLIGIVLLDFPGKRRLERWLIMRRTIGAAVNWIRVRRHRPPLQLPDRRT